MENYQNRSNEVIYYREQYKPERIKLLLIGESPPHSGNDPILHFFYNPDYNKYDNLYKVVIRSLFPGITFISKKAGLERIKESGIYLIDASDIAVNRINDENTKLGFLRSNLNEKLLEIEDLIPKKTPIVLIKYNVYELFAEILSNNGYLVLNKGRLPFPIGDQNIYRFIDFFSKNVRPIIG